MESVFEVVMTVRDYECDIQGIVNNAVYQNYLEQIKELAKNVSDPASNVSYPININTKAKQALYDNLENDEELSLVIDETICLNKLDGWRDGGVWGEDTKG